MFNTRKGEILQRTAERDRAMLEVHQFEVQVQQDVQAAAARLHDAAAWLHAVRDELLPQLREAQDSMEKLFAANGTGADLARLTDARRRYLRARDLRLDALWEFSQAAADVAAAVGDPRFAVCPPPVAGAPATLSP